MVAKLAPNVPTTPCLATVIDDSNELLPIIPGMALFIVEDPAHPEQAIPFRLVSVSRNKLVLRLKLSDGAIQDYEYKLTTKQLKNQAALKRFKQGSN